MDLSAVFRVFKNSSLVTSKGELKISRVFRTGKAAKKAHYRYFRIEDGTLIYMKRTRNGLRKYAIVGG